MQYLGTCGGRRAHQLVLAAGTPVSCAQWLAHCRPPADVGALRPSSGITARRGECIRRAYYHATAGVQTQTLLLHSEARASSPPPSCVAVDDVRAWVHHLYSPAVWQCIMAPHTVGSSSPSGSLPFASHPLLHVTSVYRPAAEADGLYTLRVGAGMPSHPADRFALNFARCLAGTVLYSGRVLRAEAELRCEFDSSFAAGLMQLRREVGLVTSPLPDVAILTRGVNLAAIDFAHPMFDASAKQRITVLYARSEYGRQLRAMLGDAATVNNTSGQETLNFSAPLDALVARLASTAGGSSGVSRSLPTMSSHRLRHPQKQIHFECVFGADLARVCQHIQASQREQVEVSKQQTTRYPAFAHVSIEAGPACTHQLYSDASMAGGHASSSLVSLSPVHTLLLSVYRGSKLSSEEICGNLVFSDEEDSEEVPATLPRTPSLTQSYLDRHYECISRHVSRSDPEWSFYWYQLKPTHSTSAVVPPAPRLVGIEPNPGPREDVKAALSVVTFSPNAHVSASITTSLLHRDAVQSILAFLDWREWLAAQATCHAWRQTALRQHRCLEWTLTLPGMGHSSCSIRGSRALVDGLLASPFGRCFTRVFLGELSDSLEVVGDGGHPRFGSRDAHEWLRQLSRCTWVRELTLAAPTDCSSSTISVIDIDFTPLTRLTQLESVRVEFSPPLRLLSVLAEMPSLRRVALSDSSTWVGVLHQLLQSTTKVATPVPHPFGQQLRTIELAFPIGDQEICLLTTTCPLLERFLLASAIMPDALPYLRRWRHLHHLALGRVHLESEYLELLIEPLKQRDSPDAASEDVASNAASLAAAASDSLSSMPLALHLCDGWITDATAWVTFLRECLPRLPTHLTLNWCSPLPAGILGAETSSSPLSALVSLHLLHFSFAASVDVGAEFESLARSAPALQSITLTQCPTIRFAHIARLRDGPDGSAAGVPSRLESLRFELAYEVDDPTDAVECARRAPNVWSIEQRQQLRPPSRLFPALRTFVYEERPVEQISL